MAASKQDTCTHEQDAALADTDKFWRRLRPDRAISSSPVVRGD